MRGHDFQAIRDTYPLVEIVSKVAKLKRAGDEWKACCPFHAERTPSFTIYEGGERYHCFGCGATGDVVHFVSAYDGVTIAEAVNRLTGGERPQLGEDQKRQREHLAKKRDEERKALEDASRAEAERRWNRAKPVDGPNGYLDRKRVAPHMSRVEGENLLVPVWDRNGDFQTVQTIEPHEGGKKLFPKNSTTSGGRFYIGIAFGKTIICEGFATGASIYEATADRVCVAFSKDNIARVARQLYNEGVSIVIAADRKALADMEKLGAELGVPVIAPPVLAKGDDFNDQQIEQGIDAVATTFRQGLIDYANRPLPVLVADAPDCAISFIDAFDFEESSIPLRPWIVPGMMLAGSTHILAAPGGTGKSLFTLQVAMMLATGKPWHKWSPRKPCNVLIVNAEDDIDEQRRRLSAARMRMEIDTTKGKVKGSVRIADNPSSILISAMDPVKKCPVATPLVDQLVAVIRHYSIDVLIVDPFAETFEGDENSNNETKWAMKVWRDQIARATNCAVYLVHHTTKNSGDKAGSADAIRGAGALVNSARLASTLFVMTATEAEDLKIPETERFQYVRYDDAKSNQSLIGNRVWFKKASVRICNGDPADSEGGDEVGALDPWEPQAMAGYDGAKLLHLCETVNQRYVDQDGVFTDIPFGMSRRGGSGRWIGVPVGEILGLDDDKVTKEIRHLLDSGIFRKVDVEDDHGRKSVGVEADIDKARAFFGAS